MQAEPSPALPPTPTMARAHKPSELKTSGMKPMPAPASISITHDNSRVSATLPTGESVEVLLYGATIISWKDAAGREKLFLSDKARLDGTKAVRGGVPLVFPVFGVDKAHEPTIGLPQHGFARISRWEFLGKTTSEGGETDETAMLDFGLSPKNLSEESRKAWPFDFGLIYSVTLSKEGLSTSMVVRNEGDTPWEFQTLMHTYLRVEDIDDVTITGLEKSKFTDKLTKPIPVTATSDSEEIKVTGEMDRVYTPVNGPAAPVCVLEKGKKTFSIVRDNLSEIVVWNPWSEAPTKMGDFGPEDGWKRMMCVEAGSVREWQTLRGGETWEGKQVMYSPVA